MLMQPTKKITKSRHYYYVFLLALVFASCNNNNSLNSAALAASRTKIKFYTLFMDSADVKEFVKDTAAKAIIFQHDNYFLKDSSSLKFELSRAYSVDKKGKKLNQYILVKDDTSKQEMKNDVFFGN